MHLSDICTFGVLIQHILCNYYFLIWNSNIFTIASIILVLFFFYSLSYQFYIYIFIKHSMQRVQKNSLNLLKSLSETESIIQFPFKIFQTDISLLWHFSNAKEGSTNYVPLKVLCAFKQAQSVPPSPSWLHFMKD